MTASYPHLLSPGRIGSMSLRNRIVMTSMGSNQADRDGVCGERSRAYYAERAKGGVGLIVIEATAIAHPMGVVAPWQVGFSGEQHVAGIKAIVDSVHEHGAKIAMQMQVGGLNAVCDVIAGRPVWTPSIPPPAVVGDMMDGLMEDEYAIAVAPAIAAGGPKYKVLSAEDIESLVQTFVVAAQRAKHAGIDGIEIHAGHGYIISSFLSPHTNQRTDDYGGSIENRSRLLVDIIKGIRAAVGPEYPLWARLDSQEFLQNEGISLEDAKITARMAQDAGLDAINVTAYASTSWGMAPTKSYFPEDPAYLVPNAAAIKAVLHIPVITVGRISPELGDKYIGEGKFDFLAMGRKLLADPHLPRKLQEGRREDVRPCIYCYACISQIYFERSVKCAVNPETGRERELSIEQTQDKKHVVVIGGGPGGMEAARRLSLKGHSVTLLEQSSRLGGTLNVGSIAYAPNEALLNWLRRQIAASKIDVRLKATATLALIRSLSPDRVVLATGAVRSLPPLPGAQRDNVFSGDDLRALLSADGRGRVDGRRGWKMRLAATASGTGIGRSPEAVRRATHIWMPFGKRIVIIGGELVGLELAEFLAERGRKVTVVDDATKFGKGLPIVRRWVVLNALKELDVTLLPEAKEIVIGAAAVTYRNRYNQMRTLAADQVIVAKGAHANLDLADEMKAAGFAVDVVGDCNGVGYIEGAMRMAAEVAQTI
jgi:2,4-dienoyl-CoA reductase (NADPH2)